MHATEGVSSSPQCVLSVYCYTILKNLADGLCDGSSLLMRLMSI